MRKDYSQFYFCFKPGISLVVFLFLSFSGFGQTISTPTVSGTPVCAGSSVDISFRINGSFTTNTVYNVFLGTSAGGAASFNVIESFQSNIVPTWGNSSPTITRTIPIPSGLVNRNDYRIIVCSSNPNSSCTTGTQSNAFTINEQPTLSFTGFTNLCQSGTFNLTGTVTGAGNKTVVLRDANNNFVNSISVPSTFTFSRTINSTTTYNFEVTDTNGCVLRQQLTISVTPGEAPTVSNNGPICIGGTLQLSASSITNATYSWTGPGGFTSTFQNPTRTNATAAMAGTYTVIATVNGCQSSPVSTIVGGAVTSDNQTAAGNNSWIGHVYDGTNQTVLFNQNFTNYVGNYTEPQLFDQSFGGDAACFQVRANGSPINILTETFSVRYRMNSTLKGLYAVQTGSDDGSRLSVNGELIYNDWNDHGYRSQNILLNLSGTSNLVLDYYENAGGNRISIGNPQLLIENNLTTNISQNLSSQSTGQPISGDIFGTLPAGITRSGTGYQWVYSTTPGGPATVITGATGASFTPSFTAAPFNTPGTYYVYRIATLIGANTGQNYTSSLKSNAAVITTVVPLAITTHPANAVTCQGNGVNFAVTASGSGLSYKWQRSNPGDAVNFFDVENTTSFQNTQTSTLTVNPTDLWMNNIRFRVIITSSTGQTITSNPALLQVNQIPQGINTQPSNMVACAGGNISFQTYTSNDQRQWQVSANNGSTWTDLINNTNYQNVNAERLDIINIPANFNNYLYRIKVSNQNCSVFSNPARLTVDLNPITQQPQNVSAAFGTNALIQAGVTGSNLSYQWQTYGTGWYDLADSEDYSGTRTNKLELITVGYWPQDGSRYRLVVTNANGCVSISNEAVLSVGANPCPAPPGVSLSAPATTCPGMVNLTGTFTGTAPWTVQATLNGQPTTLTFSQPTSSIGLNVQQNTTIVLTRITDGNSCVNEAPAASLTITVISSIPSNTISNNQASCGSFIPQTITGNNLGTGFTYIWEASTTSSTSGFSAAPGTNNQVNFSPGSISSTTWYRRKANLSNCTEGISNVVEMTINPGILNNHISLSAATSGSLRATANENGQLVMSSPSGTVFTHMDFASYGTPVDANGVYTINPTCHAQNSKTIVESYLLGKSTATIPATNAVFGDPCSGTLKRLSVQATYGQISTIICAGVNPGIIPGSTPQGGAQNFQYLWESSTTGATSGFSAAAGTNNTKDYNPGPLEVTTWFRRKVNSGNCSLSTSNAISIEVKQAVPIPVAGNNGPLCVGGTLNLSASLVTGATYQWTGPNNFSSTQRNPLIANVNTIHAGDYTVTATLNGCTSKPAVTSVIVHPVIPSTGDQNLPGSNGWIGHVYDGMNFETYLGRYSEQELFSQNFGGPENCFNLTSNGDPTSIYTHTFSVRYRNLSTKTGLYVADLRSDDGIRLKINEAVIHDNWVDRSPTTDQNVLLNLSQQENMLVYEYFENGGDNEVGFQNLRKITGNILESGIQQVHCNTNTAQTITGDGITLVPGITTVGTGYQWVYSKNVNGDKIVIPGATQKDFTPDLSIAPFNAPGEYYIYRRVSLQSSNNRINSVFNYTATHTSNAATLLIGAIPQVTFTATPRQLCSAGDVALSGSFTGSSSYLVALEINGTSAGSIPVSSNNFTLPYNVNTTTTFKITRITDQITGCINNAPNASVTIVVNQPVTGNQITGDQVLCGNELPVTLTGTVPQGGDGTFTYEWLSSPTGPDNGFVPAGGNNSGPAYNPGQLSQTTWFKRKVTSDICAENISNAVKLTVNSEISNNTISYTGSTTNICLGANVAQLTGSQPGGGNGEYLYLWESSLVSATGAFSPAAGMNNSINYTPQALTQTTWFRRVVTSPSSNCAASVSEVLKITVNPIPTAEVQVPEAVCSGQNSTISATLTGTGPWRISVLMNGTSVNLDVPTRNFSQSIPVNQTTSFEVTSIVDLGTTCVNSNPGISFTIEVNNEWIWTGAQDTNWNNPNNWSCNTLPTRLTDVLIPNNLVSGNYPLVSAGNNALAKDLIIENGASVTVSENWLRIAGEVQNFGSFNAISGSVSFEGSVAQTIPDGTFDTDRIENLRIDNTSGVVSQGPLEITGILKVTNGNFNSGNALTLISTAGKTALIDGAGMGEVLGTVSMQRYLDVAYGYKYFSTPFNATRAGDFNDINLSASFPNFYSYNEDRSLGTGVERTDATGWEAITNISAPINVLEGYALNFGVSTTPKTVSLNGVVNNGSYTRTMENNNREFTRGFHLIGNPYPSPIDWNASEGWTKLNVENGIYFFTAGTTQYTGTYTSYVNGISSTDGKSSNIIPSMQGFFVKVTNPAQGASKVTGSLTINNKARVNDFSQQFLKTREAEERSLLRLTAAFEGSIDKDAMVLYFSSNYQTVFNKETDAHKLMNTDVSVPNLYSLSEDKVNLSINALPPPESALYDKIPLGITAEKSGRMEINLSHLQNIPGHWYIYLIDKERRIGQDLRKKSTFSFNIKEGKHHDRFQLMFSREMVIDPDLIFDDKFSVASNDFLQVSLNLEEGQTGELRVNTVNGQLLDVKEGRGKEVVEFRSITSTGIYFVTLYVDGQIFSKKVMVNK